MHIRNLRFTPKPDSRVLLVSQRGISNNVSTAAFYEFEDLIRQFDQVDLIAPIAQPDTFWGKTGYKLSYQLTRSVPRSLHVSSQLQPVIDPIVLEQEYDLLYMVFEHPVQLLTVRAIQNWRAKCKVAICHMIEIWQGQPEKCLSLLKPFREFDHIFLGHHHITGQIESITGRPCSYAPAQVDALKFCPYPHTPDRGIDVTYMGRRSPVTHEALLNWAQQETRFYQHDTLKGLSFQDHQAHRAMLASQLQRSRYFFANTSKLDEPHVVGRHQEFGLRFFEGAASGTVMLGDCPTTEVFKQYFNWPDAVIRTPFHNPDIAGLIRELDAQPDRLAAVRRQNVINCLRRFDWVYTWQRILQTAGLAPTAQMVARQAQMNQLADRIEATAERQGVTSGTE